MGICKWYVCKLMTWLVQTRKVAMNEQPHLPWLWSICDLESCSLGKKARTRRSNHDAFVHELTLAVDWWWTLGPRRPGNKRFYNIVNYTHLSIRQKNYTLTISFPGSYHDHQRLVCTFCNGSWLALPTMNWKISWGLMLNLLWLGLPNQSLNGMPHTSVFHRSPPEILATGS